MIEKTGKFLKFCLPLKFTNTEYIPNYMNSILKKFRSLTLQSLKLNIVRTNKCHTSVRMLVAIANEIMILQKKHKWHNAIIKAYMRIVKMPNDKSIRNIR